MNKRLIHAVIIGVVLLVGMTVLVKLVAGASDNEKTTSHQSMDEHGQREENVVLLSQEQIKDLKIETAIAGPGEMSVTISTRGKVILHPDKIVHVLPKVSGVAGNARKNIGDAVKEGEVLAVLESREMADAQAAYLAAHERERLAFLLLEREQRLYEKRVSAEQDYLNAKSTYADAKINLQLAQQKLSAFGIENSEIEKLSIENRPDLRFYDIRSPMNGIIISRHINKGEFVENSTTIYEIADLSKVWIEIGIYPKDLIRVKEGQLIDILQPLGGKAEKARIIYLSPIIQDETITAKAIAELENPNGDWRPGSFVQVNIATENQSFPVVISKEAIQEINGKEFAFIRIPEGFEKRQIQTGFGNNNVVEILSGLKAGEVYAVSKTFLLKADLGKKEPEHAH